MAITLNDNILTDAPKPSDSRFGSYTTTVEANAATAGKRYQGLTVGILTGGSVVEYWYKDGIADGDLVEKSIGGGGTTPTLDQVTTVGNITTNAITVGGLAVGTDTLFVDAANNRVGINTTTNAGYRLDVNGTVRISELQVEGGITASLSSARTGGVMYYNTSTQLFSYSDGTTLAPGALNTIYGPDVFIDVWFDSYPNETYFSLEDFNNFDLPTFYQGQEIVVETTYGTFVSTITSIGYSDFVMADFQGTGNPFGVYINLENLISISIVGSYVSIVNTSFGKDSFIANTTGANNTALGFESGLNNSTGSGNVFIGHQAGRDATTDSDKLYIANSATNTLIYGDFSTGNVMIGSTVDNGIAKLQVQGTVSAQLTNALQTNAVYYNTTTGELTYATASSGGGGGATPTLQAVTEAGNTTTNAITVSQLSITDGTSTGFIKNAGLDNTPNTLDIVIPTASALRFGAENFDGASLIVESATDTWPPGGSIMLGYGSQQRSLANRSINFVNFESLYGTVVMMLTQSSNVLIGTTQDRGYKLEVSGGDVRIQDNLLVGGIQYSGYRLDVSGTARVSDRLEIGTPLNDGLATLQVYGGINASLSSTKTGSIMYYDTTSGLFGYLESTTFIPVGESIITIYDSNNPIDYISLSTNAYESYASFYDSSGSLPTFEVDDEITVVTSDDDTAVFTIKTIYKSNPSEAEFAGEGNNLGININSDSFFGPTIVSISMVQPILVSVENTSFGKDSFIANTTGANNTALGFESGLNNTTGSGNVFIGNQAGRDATTDSDKLYIANSATNTLIYGDFSTGNVSIGSTVDSGIAKLQVQGQVSADAYIAAGQQGLTIDIPTGAGQTLHFEGGILTSVI